MFPIIEVSGPARARGQQHGREAKARIARSVATYARLFAYCGIDWQGRDSYLFALIAGARNGRATLGDKPRQITPSTGSAPGGWARAIAS